MQKEEVTLRFGLYSSLILTFLTIITWGFAMIAVPPSGPYCPGNCMDYPFSDLLTYYPRDYFWMYLAVFQLFGYLIFVVSNHFIAQDPKKMFGFLSVSFALITTVVLLIAYVIQFSVVPISMMKGETEGIAILTQYNGHGIFIAMEDLGYFTMSISFLFLALVFSTKTRLEKTIRLVLVSAFILTAFSFVVYTIQFGIDRSYRFEVAAITINWLATIIVGILIALLLKSRIKEIKNLIEPNP